jgi:predicted RecA/RadA family phage recombinase
MARSEGNLKQALANTDTITYSNSNAASAGEVIFVSGLGCLIAAAAYEANEAGEYYWKGTFRLPIVSGVTITQGARVYWDVTGNASLLQTTTAFTAGDFLVGTAVAAGTAAGGYVDVDLNVTPVKAAPAYVTVGYGTVATGAGAAGTITVAGAQTTDVALGSLLNGWTAHTSGSASVSRCYVSAEDTVTYQISGTGNGTTNGGIAVQVIRAAV